jgi:cell division protein FtsB
MRLFSSLQARLQAAILPVVVIAVLGYLGYHVLQGPNSLKAYAGYAAELEQLEVQARQIKLQRVQLENQVRLLQPNAVDPDLLDELARKKLNYISPDELVLPMVPAPGAAPATAPATAPGGVWAPQTSTQQR